MRHKIRIKKREEEYARTVKNATSCDVFHEGKKRYTEKIGEQWDFRIRTSRT